MIDGKYNIKVASPTGVQSAVLEIKADGNKLIPMLFMKEKALPTEPGKIDGEKIAFTGKLKTPVGKMDYDFEGKIEGDNISGLMKTKKGDFPLKGVKA